MSQILIEAVHRTPGGKNINLRLRKAGTIPAVLYGRGKEPVPLAVNPKTITDVLHSESGQNTIFSLSVDGGERANVMVKDYQLDPVKGNLIHADFLHIAMDRLIEVSVNVDLLGEAEGVKAGGLLDFVTRSIEVECLPGDIPDSIKVDVSHLKINDYVRVKDIPADPKVTILTEPEVVIVTISPPLKEEVPAEVAPAEAAEPEVIKKGKAAEEGAEEEEKEKDKKKEKE
jgi:large subunit ribosomal protein L25